MRDIITVSIDTPGYYDSEEGIWIPPGYRAITLPQAQARLRKKRAVRWSLKMDHPYAFDRRDKDYQLYLQQCKEDSRALREALREVFKARNLPFFNRDKKVKNKRRLEFLIRPPFFSGHESERNENSRFQFCAEGDEFILHFDQIRTLQTVRYFHHTSALRALIRAGISVTIKQNEQFLSDYYGDWEQFALRLAFVAEKIMEQSNHRDFSEYDFMRPGD